MLRSSLSLSRRLKALTYGSFGLLLITGIAWLKAQDYLEVEGWETIPRLLMKTHGADAMLSLLVLGALATHVRRGWHMNGTAGPAHCSSPPMPSSSGPATDSTTPATKLFEIG